MKKWQIGIMAVLFMALTTTAFAFGPGGGPGFGGPGYGYPRPCYGGPAGMGTALSFSKEQTDAMWKLREKFRNETSNLRYELYQKRFEMRKLYADPSANEATILAKQKELNALRQQMQDKMVQHRLEQRKLLTPEQIKKIGETPIGPKFAGRGFGRGGFCQR